MTTLEMTTRGTRSWGTRLVMVLLLAGIGTAEVKFSEVQREQIIRAFLAENAFAHRALPRGKTGVRIEGGKITPSEAEMDRLVAQSGAVAKPGERVQITAVRFVNQGVLFEINGGAVKRKRWQDQVSVGISDPNAPEAAEKSVNNESNGSSVLVVLKDEGGIGPDRIKDLVAPVLDFKAMSQAEAYQKSLPPVLAEAVKAHRALVGMDREMVQCAVGRPPRRVRETSDGQEYEEWIYGTPPQEVEFIRFQGGKVVRIEEMKVTGEKLVRVQDEVGELSGLLDASGPAKAEERRSPPTLMRPGEKIEDHGTAREPRAEPEPAGPPAK